MWMSALNVKYRAMIRYALPLRSSSGYVCDLITFTRLSIAGKYR